MIKSPANADTRCVLVDPLDDIFGRLMVSSLVSHVVLGGGLSRNVAFARCLPFQDVGDCAETCVHGADAPQVASANHTSDDNSSFDLFSSGIEDACS